MKRADEQRRRGFYENALKFYLKAGFSQVAPIVATLDEALALLRPPAAS